MSTPESQAIPTTPQEEQEPRNILREGSDMEDVEVERLLNDEEYLPLSRPQTGPLFQNRQFLRQDIDMR